MVGGDDSSYLKFWNSRRSSNNADFQSIFARNASTVTPSEKGQLTLYAPSNEPKKNIARCR